MTTTGFSTLDIVFIHWYFPSDNLCVNQVVLTYKSVCMYIQKVEKVFYVVQNLFKILVCVSSFLTEPLKTDDFCGRPNRKKNPVDF